MGTWGYGILDNDVAMDIKGDFDEAIEGGQDFDAATWAVLEEMSERGMIHKQALPSLVRLLEDSSDLVVPWSAAAIREYALRGECLSEAPAALTERLQHAHKESTARVLRAMGALATKGFADPMAVGPLEKLSMSKAMSGHIGGEGEQPKHFTIGELAQVALADVRAAVGRAGRKPTD